jgi:hypothetical protein
MRMLGLSLRKEPRRLPDLPPYEGRRRQVTHDVAGDRHLARRID